MMLMCVICVRHINDQTEKGRRFPWVQGSFLLGFNARVVQTFRLKQATEGMSIMTKLRAH